METERDIIEACVCHKVRMAARNVTRLYDEALRPTGLRATQLIVLVAAGAMEALSITDLAHFMGMDRSTLTRNLRPLEHDELVIVGHEGWRRSRTIEITEKGRAKLRDALPHWRTTQSKLKRHLGDDNLDVVRAKLDDLVHTR